MLAKKYKKSCECKKGWQRYDMRVGGTIVPLCIRPTRKGGQRVRRLRCKRRSR